MTGIGFSAASVLVCRAQPLRPKLIECRMDVVSEYDGNGRHALDFGHSRRRSFNCLVQPRLRFGIRRLCLFKTKPVERMNIEIHEGYENWLVHLAPVTPPLPPPSRL